MDVKYNRDGILVIENFYSPKELQLIHEELETLNSKNVFLPPEKTGTGTFPDGTPKKDNHGLFLDVYYPKRKESDILQINRKIFKHIGSNYKNQNENIWLRYIISCNEDSTLLSYYNNGGYYKCHLDNSVYTILSYFHKEPKQFTGGNLRLVDFDKEFEIKNNMVICMPSMFQHEVTPVVMEEDLNYSGRYCVSQFLYVRNLIPKD